MRRRPKPRSRSNPFKRSKHSSHTEPDASAAAGGEVHPTAGGAKVSRIVVPRAPAQDAVATVSSRPGTPIQRGTTIVGMVAVLNPLPHVPRHIIEAERIHPVISNRP